MGGAAARLGWLECVGGTAVRVGGARARVGSERVLMGLL